MYTHIQRTKIITSEARNNNYNYKAIAQVQLNV